MSKFTIKQIFIDNWDKFVLENSNLNIRPVVFKEVERIINCGNPELGYALYFCEHCNKYMHVPFRCKSRFCNTCGVKDAQDRALNISKKLYVVSTGISFSLFLKNFAYIFLKIEIY